MSTKQGGKFAFPTLTFHCGLIGLVFALAIGRFFVSDAGDRHHCNALLTEGRWLDRAHQSWQPDGCMLHSYNPTDLGQCLDGRRIVFIGDSTVRQVFYAAVKHADKSIDTHGEKHSDRTINVGRIQFDFVWDPFLNSSYTTRLLDGTLSQQAAGPTPTLTVIGSGIWYLRHREAGGIPEWNKKMDAVFRAVRSTGSVIADEVVLMPVENAIESRMSPERAATVHKDDIQTMNNRLLDSLGRSNSLAIPTVFNQLIDGLEDETDDGLHFSETISKVQAQILINLRCNDVLPKRFPFDKTCCSQYPTPNWVQIALLFVLLAWAPAGLYLYSRPEASPSPNAFRFFPEQKILLPLAIFGFAVSFLFVADRTSLFLKENKQYDALTFGLLCLATIAAGLATMSPADKDLGFLNREQTDEWKGWMQIAILIYHYLGASKISGIYNPIRALVAAYLFMTGYGHLSFFLKKADFGFARVANIVVRINLLTVVLSYLLDTDYLSYYFSPLVTIWFLIIWVTMWAGHKHNDNTTFLVAKIALAAALTAAFFQIPGPLEGTFSVLNRVFGMAWNAREWRFRVALDMWIVWIGALTALAFIKIKDLRLTERPEWLVWQRNTIVGAGLAMAGYMVFELSCASKFTYNRYHPFVSSVPVLAFCVLRNATPYLRSTSSRFFVFFGQCSLETFIIQFHLFIAADTRGIIMMIPGGAIWRPINFVITSLVFVFVSHQTALATGTLTSWLCATAKKPSPATGARGPPAAGGSGPGPEYVALSTTNSEGGAEVGQDEKTIPSAPAPAPAPPNQTVVAKVLQFAAKDLRVRMAFIVVALWVVNEIYPAKPGP